MAATAIFLRMSLPTARRIGLADRSSGGSVAVASAVMSS